MQFYNGVIAPSIIAPLRYYFSRYAQGSNLIWHEDEKLRTMEIGETFDFNKIPIQEKPRVIISRGSYSISKTGLTDNLAEAKSFSETNGNQDFTNMLIYSGSAIIYIEARNKGTCELLSDMVSHFIAWTRPVLCDTQGWKEFGLPMMVSDCISLTDEESSVVKYQIQIQLPWMKEEHWRVRNDGVAIKNILNQISLES